jgi:hypothetical protein
MLCATAPRRKRERPMRRTMPARQWSRLRASVSVTDNLDNMRSKIDQRRDNHEARAAERRAGKVEDKAVDSIDFATWAVCEAEASVLEAADARMIADALA